ncbi:hypothetical protein ACFE04_029036 [Oxalis oulophora]
MKEGGGGEVESVFRYFDEDGDGKISACELKNRLNGLMAGPGRELLIKEAEVAVTLLDTNGDGLLELEDLVALMHGDDEDEKEEDLREAFEMYDEYGQGFITANDLKRMLCRLGESKSIDQCKLMIKQFDLNGDGVINYQEFKSMMTMQ